MLDVKLWLIRHAKSSWAITGQPDFERPLNKRGNADGPQMAKWLTEQTSPATWIWSSDAARAIATTQLVARGFAATAPQVASDNRLYHATPEAACEVLRETPSDVASAALVAHNPGLTWLVNLLAAGSVVNNLPTFGIARFNVVGAWHEFSPANTTLDLLMAPKKLSKNTR